MKNKMIVRFLAAVTSAVMLSGTMVVGGFAAPAAIVEAADSATTQALRSAFDANFYANKYPDVKNAYGTNADALFNHFLNNGMKEGRMMNSNFDPKAYIDAYSDIKAYCNGDYTKAYIHYVNNGIREGRTLTTYDAINKKKAAEQAAQQAAEQAAQQAAQEEARKNRPNITRDVYIGHGLTVTLNADQLKSCSIYVLTNEYGYGAFIDDNMVDCTYGFYEFGSYPYSIVNVTNGHISEYVFGNHYRPYYDDLRDYDYGYNHDESIDDALLLAHLLYSLPDDD